MLKDLQTVVMTQYNSAGGAALRALTAGLFEDEAPSTVKLQTQSGEPSNAIKPFIVFSIIFTGLEQDACSNMFEPLVQFTIFGDANNKSSIDLLTVADEFLVVFGDEILTMANGYTMIRSDTVGQRKFKDENKMWNVIIEIQYIVEKDR